MTAPNHLLGGITFTGFISTILGYSIITDVELLIVTAVACLIPDLDSPSSLLGRFVKPISRKLNQKFGHRTFTHSLIFLIISTATVSALNILFFDKSNLVATFFIAYFSHILFDMMTVSGVQFLYPLSKASFVLPGNANFRIRVNDVRQELMTFSVFFMMFIALFSFFQKGFWTSYNSLFGSVKHLRSEMLKSDSMLHADILLRSGTEQFNVSGLIVDVKDNIKMLVDSSLVTIPDEFQEIEDIEFRHTDKSYFVDRRPYEGSLDGLNEMLKNRVCLKLELKQDSNEFEYKDLVDFQVPGIQEEEVTAMLYELVIR